jgi:hypothetical protein
MKKNCNQCGQLITTNNRSQAKFCNRICFQLAHGMQQEKNKKPNTQCAWCTKPIWRKKSDLERSLAKHGRIILFCNRTCFCIAKRLDGIQDIHPPHYGTSNVVNYRLLAFDHYEKRCARCGYCQNTLALDVHHKDHNHSNNEIINLEILCCNCHMIEHRSRKQYHKFVGPDGLEPSLTG